MIFHRVPHLLREHLQRWTRCGVFFFALSLAIVSASDAQTRVASSRLRYFRGEYVVTLPVRTDRQNGMAAFSSTSLEDRFGVIENLGGSTLLLSKTRVSGVDGTVSRFGMLESLISVEDSTCKALLAEKVVTSCTPNYVMQSSDVMTNDPYASQLWGLSQEQGISVAQGWDVSSGTHDVVVAVIDTGIDYRHEDLVDNLWRNPGEIEDNGIDDDNNGFVDDVYGINAITGAPVAGDPFDDNGHGTHVAGTIGAVGGNGIGVVGVNRSVSIMGLKFLDSSGSGRLSDAITAINYMVNMKESYGVDIVVANNSWGGGGYSQALEDAIERANAAGIVFVAAAGNQGLDVDLFPSYPSSYENSNVVSVAALDSDGNLATFSNFGSEGVDVAAPGVGILSTLPGDAYGSYSGTSMAAPHVTGLLALLYSVAPDLSVEELATRLFETGRDLIALGAGAAGPLLVKTGRIPDAGRLLRDERLPLPVPPNNGEVCPYEFDYKRIFDSNELDTSADGEAIVNQSDEGGYVRVDLPFDFPFHNRVIRTVFVSPNGVVYEIEPHNLDYLTSYRAPYNSIAAMHIDLTPRRADEGVRVFSGHDRVTILWKAELYMMPDIGPLSVRLTLYSTGRIMSTVSFEEAGAPEVLSKIVLGDAFSDPVQSPMGIMGIGGATRLASSTADLLAAQRLLMEDRNEEFSLKVTMDPTCEVSGGNREIIVPHIQ
jgi:subtilisin family serine protease